MTIDNNYSKLTFQHLQYFIKIAQLGTMSQAAQELFVTQPLLSQKIAQLEQILGVKLFTRTKQRIVLTEAGTQFLKDSEEIIDLFDQKISALKSHVIQSEKLRIGFYNSHNRKSVQRILNHIREHVPDTSITAQLKSASEIWELVYNGELDMAMFIDGNDIRYTSSIHYHTVSWANVSCIMHENTFKKIGSEFSWRALENLACLFPRSSKGTRMDKELRLLSKKMGANLKIEYVDETLLTLRNYLPLGDYCIFAYAQKEEVDLRTCVIDELQYPFVVVWQKKLPERIKKQIPVVIQCIEESAVQAYEELIGHSAPV